MERLRSIRQRRRVLDLLIVDRNGHLSGTVSIQEVVLAEAETTLLSLVTGVPVSVSAFTTREEIVEAMERHKLTSIPVIDYDNKPLGIIRLNEMVSAVEEELSADLVSMTGASKEERALSKVSFAIRKRLPWLQINLATAFLAASVVGVFEDTISRFTALAVLLPVVAGQSGNTGAQALAVVLRGLALREITLRHWPQVVTKEFTAGLVNGLGVALVTCAGVYVWSGSTGLVFVIGLAMVLSMAIAGVAGAMIPVLLGENGAGPGAILLNRADYGHRCLWILQFSWAGDRVFITIMTRDVQSGGTEMTMLLVVAGLTVLISSMCSLFEATLYSTRTGSLEAERAEGKHVRLAERFIAMKANIAGPTSAILILNTVANTAGATLCGMFAAQVLGSVWVPAFSVGLTVAILFVGEILPKTYGATHWRNIWHLTVWPLTLMQKGFSPLIRVTQAFSGFFTGGLGVPAVTEDEIRADIHLGRKAGEFVRLGTATP